MSGLVALDLASNVGIARFRARGQVPTFDTLRLEGLDLSYKIGQLLARLFDEYDSEPFEGLAWERPILTPKDTVDLIELLYGLVGACYAFVGLMRRREGIHLKWTEVSTDDVKRALCHDLFVFDERLNKRRKVDKNDMLHAARTMMGWRVRTDHEADAGGVGMTAFDRFWPRPVAA